MNEEVRKKGSGEREGQREVERKRETEKQKGQRHRKYQCPTLSRRAETVS